MPLLYIEIPFYYNGAVITNLLEAHKFVPPFPFLATDFAFHTLPFPFPLEFFLLVLHCHPNPFYFPICSLLRFAHSLSCCATSILCKSPDQFNFVERIPTLFLS